MIVIKKLSLLEKNTKKDGCGRNLLQALLTLLHTNKINTLEVHGIVKGAVDFYKKTGAEFIGESEGEAKYDIEKAVAFLESERKRKEVEI